MKKIVAVLLVVAALITMVSCNEDKNQTDQPQENTTPAEQIVKEKSFTSNGLSITLTEDFVKSSQPGYTVCYDSESVAVIALKESFSLQAGIKDWTLEHYADLVKSSNAAHSPSTPKKVGDRMVMEYTFYNSETKITYHYYTCMYKGSDAFWTIQFVCNVNEIAQHKADMVKWADSVRV